MKSYTDLEQSRKLAEILPLESADMNYSNMCPKGVMYSNSYSAGLSSYNIASRMNQENIDFYLQGEDYKGIIAWKILPCWSLAALMSIFPKEEGSCPSISYGYYDANGNYISSWLCCYEKEGESTDDYIIETIPADNPIDCCYEMILKLKEKGLL